MINVTPDLLKAWETLKDVPANQLQWLIDNSENVTLPIGDFLFKPEDAINYTYFIIKGSIRMYMLQNNEMSEITVFETAAITGHLPFSRGRKANAYGEATMDTQVMRLEAGKISHMICTHFDLTQALVHVMSSRVRNFTALQQQNEKMMALGKLSAGLAHELNNPASAVVRGAMSLKEHINYVRQSFQQVADLKIGRNELDAIAKRLCSIIDKKETPFLSLMERSEREDELTDWMDDQQIDNGPEIAENFVEFGLTMPEVESFSTNIPASNLSPVLRWMSDSLVTEKIVRDIEEGAKRIAGIVGSVKNFTHMDQSHEKEYADIHNGIRNTLTMLNHKIQKGKITVIENFNTSLPPVKAMIGELNQVWTNLIDNAIDAMEGGENGKLEIKTEQDDDYVCVYIIDNGPGIPEAALSKIFDPFFTTKPIGKGTGLGLDVVIRILRQHRGTVKVNSVPGKTVFKVCFPING